MTGFSAEWLALREPADARARDVSLTEQFVQGTLRSRRAGGGSSGARAPGESPALGAPERSEPSPVRFIDLGCGTGANFRYLAPRVGGEQQWLLVDSDVALLDKASGALSAQVEAAAGSRVETRRLDLTTELGTLDFTPGTIVTASALLDLVSDHWLSQLVEQCCAHRCTALFALSYDGRIALTPSDPDDEWIRQLVNRHQLGDKGFGPALGPGASQRTCELFREAGYEVRSARSDWRLLPAERLLQQLLLEGWAGAAMQLAPGETDRCRRWLARRLAHVANEASRIVVGHEDVLGWPRR